MLMRKRLILHNTGARHPHFAISFGKTYLAEVASPLVHCSVPELF